MAKNFLSQFDKDIKLHTEQVKQRSKDKHKDILTVPHYHQTAGRQTENPKIAKEASNSFVQKIFYNSNSQIFIRTHEG